MANINWCDHYFAACMTSQADEIVRDSRNLFHRETVKPD